MNPSGLYAHYIDEPETPRPSPLVPPLCFSMVSPGVYRSGYPLEINFPMLEKLKLRTIIYLADTDYLDENITWCQRHDITVHHYRVPSVREPFVENDPVAIESALRVLSDRRNFPLLVHSNKGKHRVGVLIGCMRKLLQKWSLTAIYAEYMRFAGEKGDADLEFIELFEPKSLGDVPEDSRQEWLVT
ncbi:protein-tyrosine phosphatase [Xylona heveae TC161]|uniref:Protein-tyrosine phosphatase n=1 Tax=Xylona heveae (strain CBS 132557 / TC161) TaxID=1328760 RepID=A0A165JAD9_XYLHT|nr:protein-tyrosine phosphatase [Xylona heveae TC161]KZF25967.1 protein-tyrosine phosphatase [Xylona heveae TC161]